MKILVKQIIYPYMNQTTNDYDETNETISEVDYTNTQNYRQ